jgi:hypothetical integral membrane protein (TIGR02206 family)
MRTVHPLTDDRFVDFGPQHLVVLGIFALGIVTAVLAGDRLRARPALDRRVRRLSGVLVIAACGPFETLDWINGIHHWRTALPLQICDFGWIVAGVALITGLPAWSALLYYWGLTLCVQGVITPDLPHVFPQAQFFGYWVRHLAPPWAAAYLVGARVGPTWREYRIVVVATAAVVGLAMALNRILGSNYDYLNAKPVTHSALSLLGPWPWYVVAEVALVVAFWALITWPWERRTRA